MLVARNITLGPVYVSVKSKLQHAPPGNPPGIWLFWKLLFKFPPTRAKMPFKCPTLCSIQVIKCPHPGDVSQAQKCQSLNTSNTAQSLFKPFPRNQLATKAQSFPRKSSNTASPMIARHAKDFTWNRGWSSNSPPLKHGDQIPHPLKDSDNQIPSSPGRQRCQIPGVCPGGGGTCWSFDLTDTLRRGNLSQAEVSPAYSR